jgi:hypothetical protein
MAKLSRTLPIPSSAHRLRALRRLLFAATMAGLVAWRPAAQAQQAIVTLPSADITPTGKLFFMHETQARIWGDAPYWSGTYFTTYGLTPGLELAATVFDVGVFGGGKVGNPSLALGAKGRLELFEAALPSLDLCMIAGAMAVVALDGDGVGHWLYSSLSGKVPWLDTRLSVGASHASSQFYGPGFDTISFTASVEQPIPGIHGLSLVAEWFSGRHELSNFIGGVTYHPNPTWIFVAGWKVPTQDGDFKVDEQALVLEVGLFLPVLAGASQAGGAH